MTTKAKAVSGVLYTFLQQFSGQGIGFLVSIVLARILLPEEFGVIAMITVFMGIGNTLVNGGLTSSLIRTSEADQKDFSTVFFFNLLGSILVYLLLFISAPLIADFFEEPILLNLTRLYGVTFIINAFSTVQTTRLTQKMDFKTQLKVSIPSLIGSGVLGIVLAYWGFGVWSLVWMYISQAFLNSLQLWLVTNWKPSLIFDVSKFKYHFNFGYKILFSGLLDTIFKNSYSIVIGKIFSPALLGYYSRANTVVQLPVSNISGALSKVTYPLFSKFQDDDVRLKNVYKKILQMVTFVLAPVLMLLAVLGEPFFRFLFTEKWLPSVPYFQILCISGLLYPFHSYNLNILNVKGRSDLFLKLEIYKKIILVISIAISIPYGILGLLWARVGASVLGLIINTHYSGRFINYNLFQQMKDVSSIFILVIITGFMIRGLDDILLKRELSDLIRIIVGLGIGSIFYVLVAYLLKYPSINEFKNIILKK